MKRLSLLFSVILPLLLSGQQPIIIDHTCIDLDQIPDQYIDSAKANLWIGYGHTSHGNHLTRGMDALEDYFTDGTYDWSHTGGPDELHLFEGSAYSPGYLEGALAIGGDWANESREYLDDFPGCNVIIWAWCGDLTYTNLQTHLFDPLEQLELDYPDVQFVIMTGHLEGAGIGGNVQLANNQIRDYCIQNNKILYDFADIEKYSPDADTNFQEYYANDACDYNHPNGGTANWATDWIASNPGHELTQISQLCAYCNHSEKLNCTKKGIAAWYLWARLAGWGGDTTLQLTSSFQLQDTTCINGNVDIIYSGNASASATYNWDFDGATIISGSGQGPYTVEWTSLGDKTVSLYVEESGSISDTSMNNIYISELTSSFNLQDTTCIAHTVDIIYTGNAPGSATYHWDFDGATIISGSGQGPYTVQWPSLGDKSVSLYIEETGYISDTTTNDIYIEYLTSGFQLPDTSCRSCPVEITYMGNASDTAAYYWGFDGATIISGSGQGPYTVEWSSDGDKTVSLCVEESGFISDTTTNDIYIVFVTSDFQVQDTACVYESVDITYTGNASTSAIYNWDFDGATIISGSGQGPYTVEWPSAGDKTVSLYVEEPGFVSDTTLNDIHIVYLTSDFQLEDAACISTPVDIIYTGNASASAIYHWDFDNANIISGSGQGPYMVEWLNAGARTVSLYVEESTFVSDTTTNNIDIVNNPVFTIIPYPNDTVTTLDTVTLTGDITSVSYLWSTGDTTQSIHATNTCGTAGGCQNYWLWVTDETGCSSMDSIAVVFEGPTLISEFTNDLEIKVYPNPYKDKLNIELKITDKGQYLFEVINSMGLPVIQELKYLNPGRQIISLNVNHSYPGINILSVKSDGRQLGIYKIIKTQ